MVASERRRLVHAEAEGMELMRDTIAIVEVAFDAKKAERQIQQAKQRLDDIDRASIGIQEKQRLARIEIGKFLIDARKGCARGEWTPLLARCGVDKQRASEWMRLAGFVEENVRQNENAGRSPTQHDAGIDKRKRKSEQETGDWREQMAHQTLDNLDTDQFELDVGAPPLAGLRTILAQTNQVRSLRDAMRSGEVTEPEIHAFVQTLLARLTLGVQFEAELALAAIAVALEPRSTAFAEEYIRDLAKLKLSELRRAIAVAQACRRERARMPATRQKEFRSTMPALQLRYGEQQGTQSSRSPTIKQARDQQNPDKRALLVAAVFLFAVRDCDSPTSLLSIVRDGSVARNVELIVGKLLLEIDAVTAELKAVA
jgi:hypothetical protein